MNLSWPRRLLRIAANLAAIWLIAGEIGSVYAAAAPAAAAAAPGVTLQVPGLSVHGDSTSWTILALMTLLTLLPALLLSATPFVRILVIFHFLRQALGTQSTPANQTLIGLSLFLTYFLMQPVGTAIYQQAIVPMESGTITAWEAVDRGSTPLREFMMRYTREKDLALFVDMAQQTRPKTPPSMTTPMIMMMTNGDFLAAGAVGCSAMVQAEMQLLDRKAYR